jgi:hypothetical protein
MEDNMTNRTYKGKSIDMASIRAKNEKTLAVGNMGVNAKGEKIVNGKVVETSNKRVRQQVNIPMPTKDVSLNTDDIDDEPIEVDNTKSKRTQVKKTTSRTTKAPVEKELDNGDIVIDDDAE